MYTIDHWISGQRVAGASGKTGPVFNPATGQQQGEVALASVAEVDKAVAVAKEAFSTWRSSSLSKRADILFAFRQIVHSRRDEIANLVSQSDKPLSELIAPIRRYFASGEINSTVSDSARVFQALRAKYADADLLELDGLSFEYPTWWFNVRSSNTEPLVRLNLEAKTKAEMEQRRDEVLTLIRG